MATYRTYLDKCNTIIRNSNLNTGISPIMELNYGNANSRILVHFPIDKIKKLIDDKVCPDVNKFRHTLKITNAGSIDFTDLHCNRVSSINTNNKVRATSFDLIFFLIPKMWDEGKGFAYTANMINIDYYTKAPIDSNRMLSIDGSNWEQARNGYEWDEKGIYSTKRLSYEYDNFSTDSGSTIIIGRQHFDTGNENISLDITDVVNKFINGELENYGIGIAFSPMLEYQGIEDYKSGAVKNLKINEKLKPLNYTDNYVGFFSNHTNTFFEPFVESVYDDVINDDRKYFPMNKKNRLYFYSSIAGNPVNLDEMPTCQIKNQDEEIIGTYEVKQTTKGAYYVDVMFKSDEYEAGTMLYDVWGNIKYNGVSFKDVELDFILNDYSSWFSIGSTMGQINGFTPTTYGITSEERIKRGDIRKLGVRANVEYSDGKQQLFDNIQVRLYVKDGEREITVVDFENVNKTFDENYILIDTSMLIPQKYYVDIKFKYNMQEIIHNNVLNFRIVENLNNKYY